MSLLQLLRFHICTPALRFFTICKYFCSSDILYTFFKVFCLTYYWFHFFFFSLTLSPCLLSSVWCLVSSAKESHSKNKLCPREISRVKLPLMEGHRYLLVMTDGGLQVKWNVTVYTLIEKLSNDITLLWYIFMESQKMKKFSVDSF